MDLTKTEKQVLEFILKGYTQKETAVKMFVTSYTVASHITSIYKKLDVHNINQLMAWHIKNLEKKIKYLELQAKQLEPYKQKWEYLREKAFAERK